MSSVDERFERGEPIRKPRSRFDKHGRRVYRIQATRAGFVGPYHMAVPANVARMIGQDAEFTIELNDDGLLYRKVGGATEAENMPRWLRGDDN